MTCVHDVMTHASHGVSWHVRVMRCSMCCLSLCAYALLSISAASSRFSFILRRASAIRNTGNRETTWEGAGASHHAQHTSHFTHHTSHQHTSTEQRHRREHATRTDFGTFEEQDVPDTHQRLHTIDEKHTSTYDDDAAHGDTTTHDMT